MAQKIFSAKVRRQKEKMIKQINQMEENYRTAAIKYFDKQLDLALFRLNHNKTINYTEFRVYPPLTIDDITEKVKEKLKDDFCNHITVLGNDILLVNISKKEK